MTIPITNVAQSTAIVIFVLLAIFFLSLRKTEHSDLFPIAVTQELKGFGILSVVFAHIAYVLVSDNQFLYPLSIAAGTGVDLFLFMSGFGLTIGMRKKTLSAKEFYKRRLIRVFIPFWIVLFLLYITDAGLL
ncbi:MAG: acyltransferase family protein, partial [Sulfurimonas sp.]|nr:acyltransferase family protein [Sulfurimonas sp.]